MIQLWL